MRVNKKGRECGSREETERIVVGESEEEGEGGLV